MELQEETKNRENRQGEQEVYRDDKYLIVITKSTSARIPIAEITMVQHANRRILLYRTGNPDPVVYPGKIKDCLRMLEEGFYLCTNTLGINLEQVETMRQGEVIFYDGERIFIGRDNFIRTRKAFNRYLEDQGRRSLAFEEKCRKIRER